MLQNTFMSELDKYITMYGSMLHFDNVKENDEGDLITPRDKLNFQLKRMFIRKKLNLQTTSNTIKHFGILCRKKYKK